MKQIEIPYCEEIGRDSDLSRVSAFLDTLDCTGIETQSWPEYSYRPTVGFVIAHSGDCIFLKFSVVEKFVQAHNRTNNSPVNQDSCVEFFISLDGGQNYYNFEFNCIGTCKTGFGSRIRKERAYLSDDLIDRISRQALIKAGNNGHNGLIAWDLTVAIPAEVFAHDRIQSFKGLNATANFYKCGDHLPEPHFVAWNEVKAAKPDFHLPEFFGKVRFL